MKEYTKQELEELEELEEFKQQRVDNLYYIIDLLEKEITKIKEN